jgi:hypothetical protein
MWAERRVYEPCAADPVSGCCGCPQAATQEDLLCDTCRERGGISTLDERRIIACLTSGSAP